MGASLKRDEAVQLMAESMESLAGGTAATFADDLLAGAAHRHMTAAAPGLVRLPLLVLTADDSLASHSDSLVAAIKRLGGTRVTTRHVATDHSWSDRRVTLIGTILRWLDATVPARRGP